MSARRGGGVRGAEARTGKLTPLIQADRMMSSNLGWRMRRRKVSRRRRLAVVCSVPFGSNRRGGTLSMESGACWAALPEWASTAQYAGRHEKA
jgi:hypothetical protein